MFVCLFVVINPKNPYFTSRLGLEVVLGSISTRAALPAGLSKVHHRPEPLYVPTEVNDEITWITLNYLQNLEIAGCPNSFHVFQLRAKCRKIDPATGVTPVARPNLLR